MRHKDLLRYRCDALNCGNLPIKAIAMNGNSIIDKEKKYLFWANVCQEHYNREKDKNGIVKEQNKLFRSDY